MSRFYGKLLCRLYRRLCGSGCFTPGVEREKESVLALGGFCVRLLKVLQETNALIFDVFSPARHQKSNTEEILYPGACGKRFKEQRGAAAAGRRPGIPPQPLGGGELRYSQPGVSIR